MLDASLTGNNENFDALFGDRYADRAQEFLNNKIDLQQSTAVKQKLLHELTADDLREVGFLQQHDPRFDPLYAIQNLDSLKIYLTIENGQYNLRGFQLRLLKEVFSTDELIHEALINWRLKMS